MDANVLRAAVSAALRVTVSTTLIGCGGSLTSGADGADTASNGSAGSSSGHSTAVVGSGGYRAPSPVPVGTSASGGTASGASTGAGTAGTTGETDTGGVDNAGGVGQAGEAASAGAPAAICGEAVDACLTLLEQELLEQEPPGAPLSDAGKACCDTVVVGFDDLRLSNAQCFGDLDRRFMVSGVRGRCCSDQATWSHLACTPWGPPVPPELPAELLRAWSLAA
jgi:hypothetical protein